MIPTCQPFRLSEWLYSAACTPRMVCAHTFTTPAICTPRFTPRATLLTPASCTPRMGVEHTLVIAASCSPLACPVRLAIPAICTPRISLAELLNTFICAPCMRCAAPKMPMFTLQVLMLSLVLWAMLRARLPLLCWAMVGIAMSHSRSAVRMYCLRFIIVL